MGQGATECLKPIARSAKIARFAEEVILQTSLFFSLLNVENAQL
jgi:hypothetical protein